MKNMFSDKKTYKLRIDEINKLMSSFGYENAHWEESNNTYYYISEEKGVIKNNIKISVSKNLQNTHYIKNIDISPLDPILLLQLYDKLDKDIRKEYLITDKLINRLLSIIKHLVNYIDKYNKGDYNSESEIIDLYMMAYFPNRDINSRGFYTDTPPRTSVIVEDEKGNYIRKDIDLESESLYASDYINKYFSVNFKNSLAKLLINQQKDLDLFSIENRFLLISQSDFDYKTKDGLFILELMRGSGRQKKEIKNNNNKKIIIDKYDEDYVVSKNSFLEPDWTYKFGFNFLNQTCPLKYASDELLNNKKFLINYINQSTSDYEIFNYIPNQVKRDSDFINECVKNGYMKEKILSTIQDDNSIKIGEHIFHIKEEVREIKRRSLNGNVSNELKKKQRIDYLKKHEQSQKNGQSAEEWVYEYERQKMIENGREDLLDKVILVSKNISEKEGFDILSCDPETDEPIYIEVKSSKGNTFDGVNITSKEFLTMNESVEKGYNWKMYFVTKTEDENKEHDVYIKTADELIELFDFVPSSYSMKVKENINKKQMN